MTVRGEHFSFIFATIGEEEADVAIYRVKWDSNGNPLCQELSKPYHPIIDWNLISERSGESVRGSCLCSFNNIFFFFLRENVSYYFSPPLGLCLLAGQSVPFFVLGEMKENRRYRVRMNGYAYGHACVRARACVPACPHIYARSNRDYDLPCIKAYQVTLVRTCHYVVLQTAI